jgi:hypothetical protein
MGYSSHSDRKPFERASKSSHHHIINDAGVQNLVERCWLPAKADDVSLEKLLTDQEPVENPIEAIIAVDGGYTEVVVRKEFPSATIAFLQFGALLFKSKDLAEISKQPFIAPEDMAKLKNLERIKLALPIKNLRFKQGAGTLTETIRTVIFEFFCNQKLENSSLIETLAWFLFKRFQGNSRQSGDEKFHLAQNPHKSGEGVDLFEEQMKNYSFNCPKTGNLIFLTDVFRFHEVIDEERGAAGILGYLTNTVEHLLIIHLIRTLLHQQPSTLQKVFFIKDGPTGFFGQTARLHEPMRQLVGFLVDHHDIYLAGLEKSGAFVEHAQEIAAKMPAGKLLILSNDYIYRYILPGQADPSAPYGRTTNYGHKIIFKTSGGQMHVVSIPARDIKANPTEGDLVNLQSILANVEALHCDMYDSALIPVALVNKLVSLADHPSARILQKFATAGVQS